MSLGFAAVPNWLVEDEGISAHEKLVYLILSSRTGDQGAWFTGHAPIARAAGISVSSVQRALASLREHGLVEWEQRSDPTTGAQLSNRYRLMVDRLGQDDRPPRSGGPTPPVSVTEQRKNPEKEPINTPPTPSFFDAAWSTWPKKADKKMARKAWVSAAKRHPGGEGGLMMDAKAHGIAHALHTPPKFVKNFSTWLNNDCWENDKPVAEDRGAHKPEPAARPRVAAIPPGHKPIWSDEGYIIGSEPA